MRLYENAYSWRSNCLIWKKLMHSLPIRYCWNYPQLSWNEGKNFARIGGSIYLSKRLIHAYVHIYIHTYIQTRLVFSSEPEWLHMCEWHWQSLALLSFDELLFQSGRLAKTTPFISPGWAQSSLQLVRPVTLQTVNTVKAGKRAGTAKQKPVIHMVNNTQNPTFGPED